MNIKVNIYNVGAVNGLIIMRDILFLHIFIIISLCIINCIVFFIFIFPEIEAKKRSNTRSVIVLLVLTNIISPFMVGMGYIITKILKKPGTSLDVYGWRGVGFGCIALAMVLGYVTFLLMVRETDAILGIVSFSILFFIVSLFTGKKLITDWT